MLKINFWFKKNFLTHLSDFFHFSIFFLLGVIFLKFFSRFLGQITHGPQKNQCHINEIHILVSSIDFETYFHSPWLYRTHKKWVLLSCWQHQTETVRQSLTCPLVRQWYASALDSRVQQHNRAPRNLFQMVKFKAERQ